MCQRFLVATEVVLYSEIVSDGNKATLARPVTVEGTCSSPCGDHFEGSKITAENKWCAKNEFFVTASSHAGCTWEFNV